ncbi:uncharacterized protein LOC119734678 [Patiria miniata]|uniref:Uncharacterized protein n=1 Tax=Patiria miniata TaxID=46514 RepID=A0A914AJH3_PATMI|nr:uncharacterized protein LOC119734678 [Patiria miniata]
MYPALFQRPRDKAADTRPTMPRHHGHHHAAHHHHHAHHNRHRHHNVHHHTHVSSVGTPMGAHVVGGRVGTPMGSVVGLGACLGTFGFFFLFSGIMMMSFGFNFAMGLGIVGCIFFILGLSLMMACVVFCRRGRMQQQQQIALNQQGVTTLVYGQPGAQPQIVQPVQPGAPPIIQPQGPGATIMYGPGGQVAYQPQLQPGIHPPPQQYPATIPYPQQDPSAMTPKPYPSTDSTAPPPTYEDAVNSESIPEKDNSGPAMV